jgi:AraC family transcriptional regulator of adaptative response/methylated-DNA-[protein]-cysteine methyltransferase
LAQFERKIRIDGPAGLPYHGGMNDDQRWQLVLNRTASADGQFVTAVKSTRIYCRPSCPARHPLRKNVAFYATPHEAERAGFRPCRRCRPNEPNAQTEQIHRLARYMEAHLDEPLTLDVLSQKANLSPYHLQRTFKKIMGVSPKQYVQALRVKQVKARLKDGETVAASVYEAGFGSSSRLYERDALGMTPGRYQQGGAGMTIGYTITDSPLGRMIVGATARGVCFVGFGEKDERLAAELHQDYPLAEITPDPKGFGPWVRAIVANLNGRQPHLDLPLDVRGTAFQQQVWEALRRIPYGQTRTYGEIAQAIGQPNASRAVGRACATNRAAVVIPCHRAVGSTGALTGYRWGVERKQVLLEQEAS